MWPRLRIESRLSPETSARRIESITRPRRSIRQALDEDFPWPKRVPKRPAFVGKVNDRRFRLRRAIRYGNSFLPIIKGHIVPSREGTIIEITMRPSIPVMVFMGVWLLGALAAIVAMFRQAPASASMGTEALSFAGFLAIAAVIVALCFVPEQQKAARLLRGAFEGTAPHGQHS